MICDVGPGVELGDHAPEACPDLHNTQLLIQDDMVGEDPVEELRLRDVVGGVGLAGDLGLLLQALGLLGEGHQPHLQ